MQLISELLAIFFAAVGIVVMVMFIVMVLISEPLLVFFPVFSVLKELNAVEEKIRKVKLVRQVRYPYDILPEVKELQKSKRVIVAKWAVVALVCWSIGIVFWPAYVDFLEHVVGPVIGLRY